jgi:hypothetical protein
MTEEFEVTTADMLEIVAGGGNGVEYVDVNGLIEKAAQELRDKDTRIAVLEAAIEPFRRVKAITSIYEYVPVEALRDDEEFSFRMNGAEMKTIRAALKGERG